MMLSHSFGLHDEARAVETAITSVLATGMRTADIVAPPATPLRTSEFAEAVVGALG
jgi:3-isopropylmalate dehydrogenase